MTNYILLYLGVGAAALILHRHIRAEFLDVASHQPKGVEVILKPVLLILLAVLIMVAWPVAIFRCKPRDRRTLLDTATKASGEVIVAGYRRIAAQHGCAPTQQTSDEKIIEIYTRVGTSFNRTAEQRAERIPALQLNHIVLKFLQMQEDLGPEIMASHLQYEIEKYATSGLRADYQQNLSLLPFRLF